MAATLEVNYFNTFWLKKLKSITNIETVTVLANASAADVINLQAASVKVGAGQTVVNNTTPFSGTVTVLSVAANDQDITIDSSQTVALNDSLTFSGVAPDANIPQDYDGDAAVDWYIEEARIRGGYNNTSVDFGVKAYLVEDTFKQQHRISSMIYSGIFNSRTGVNNTNQFSVAQDITKSADPANGSIQRLYAEDTNLIIFQENKVSRALIDKDAIYTAEGNPAVTSTNIVIGQIIPFTGKYGIATDPYSFAVYGNRKYFTDRKRGCVMRLSSGVSGGDGLTEISSYGMHDFFRDELSGNIEKIVGGWDMHTKNYILSIQNTPGTSWIQATSGASAYGPGNGISVTLSAPNPNLTAGMNIYNNTTGVYYGYVVSVTSTTILVCNLAIQVPAATTLVFKIEDYKTVTFDEGVLGWTSLSDYKPSWMFSLVSDFYSTFTGKVYKHYGNSDYSNFYGIEFDSTVTVILNAKPSVMKVFKTINYEGGSNWTVTTATASSGDIGQVPITRYILPTSLVDFENELFTNSFKKKENKYFANILNNSPATPGEVIFGENMTGIKGFFSTIKLTLDNSINEKRELFAVSSETVESSY